MLNKYVVAMFISQRQIAAGDRFRPWGTSPSSCGAWRAFARWFPFKRKQQGWARVFGMSYCDGLQDGGDVRPSMRFKELWEH